MLFPFIAALNPALATSSAFDVLNFENIAELSILAFFSKSVEVGPGHNAVTDTPVPFNSSYNASENDNTKLLDA